MALSSVMILIFCVEYIMISGSLYPISIPLYRNVIGAFVLYLILFSRSSTSSAL